MDGPEDTAGGTVWPLAANADDDEAIIHASRARAGTWVRSSSIPGDLVCRLQDQSKLLVIELLECGLKRIAMVPYADVEVLHVEPFIDENDAGFDDFTHECRACAERFGTGYLRKHHQTVCPRHQAMTLSQAGKRPRDDSLMGVHFSLKKAPSFFSEVEVDFGIQLTPCDDICAGELLRTLQLSIILRSCEEAHVHHKLSDLLLTVCAGRREVLSALEKGNERAAIGVSILKYFKGFGFFRGTIEAFDSSFFSVVYSDGDGEDLDRKEMQACISASLPHSREGTRKRGRERVVKSTAYPRSSSRVGDKYQALVEDAGASALPMALCFDAVEADFVWPVAHKWSQEEAARFTSLMLQHQKNFRLVQRDLRPERSMSDILQYYYSFWKQTRQYAILKNQRRSMLRLS